MNNKTYNPIILTGVAIAVSFAAILASYFEGKCLFTFVLAYSAGMVSSMAIDLWGNSKKVSNNQK